MRKGELSRILLLAQRTDPVEQFPSRFGVNVVHANEIHHRVTPLTDGLLLCVREMFVGLLTDGPTESFGDVGLMCAGGCVRGGPPLQMKGSRTVSAETVTRPEILSQPEVWPMPARP